MMVLFLLLGFAIVALSVGWHKDREEFEAKLKKMREDQERAYRARSDLYAKIVRIADDTLERRVERMQGCYEILLLTLPHASGSVWEQRRIKELMERLAIDGHVTDERYS